MLCKAAMVMDWAAVKSRSESWHSDLLSSDKV